MFKRLQASPGLHFLGWKVGVLPATTQTTPAEQECLTRHARDRRRILEIGVWHGVNTRRLRSVMAPDGILYGIDPFPRGRLGFSWQRNIAHREVSRAQNGTVRFLEMTSVEAARQFDALSSDPLDFVFVDGEHSYEGLRADWTLWTPRLRRGGVIALHDSHSSPTRAIDHAGSVVFTREHVLKDSRFRVIEVVDSLTVLERVADHSAESAS